MNKDSDQTVQTDLSLKVHQLVPKFAGERLNYIDCSLLLLTKLMIDHEIISTVILLPSTESYKKGCCQLQAKVCAQSTG